MSFWELSDGTSATTAGKEFDGGGGRMEPIPDGTTVLAMPDEAKWAEDRNSNEFLSIRWSVIKPEAYANRKVFHKLWISDPKPGTKDPKAYRDKALMMFSAIDSNAGGKLLKKAGKPTDDELALALTGKQMTLKLGVWEMEGDNGLMSGNWVIACGPKDKAVSEVAPPRAKVGNGAGGIRAPLPFEELEDDDVPFISNGMEGKRMF